MDTPAESGPGAELLAFYERHGFGPSVGRHLRTVPVYTGCLRVPLPNIETRSRYLKYHDLHHLLAGHGVGRLGEGEMSAWQLGTGSTFTIAVLAMMNLIALSTGLFLQPRRMWHACQRGCRGESLYTLERRRRVENRTWPDTDALRSAIVEVQPARLPTCLGAAGFAICPGLALLAEACLAVPAVLVRVFSPSFDRAEFYSGKQAETTGGQSTNFR